MKAFQIFVLAILGFVITGCSYPEDFITGTSVNISADNDGKNNVTLVGMVNTDYPDLISKCGFEIYSIHGDFISTISDVRLDVSVFKHSYKVNDVRFVRAYAVVNEIVIYSSKIEIPRYVW